MVESSGSPDATAGPDPRVPATLARLRQLPNVHERALARLARACSLSQSRLAHLVKAGTGCTLARHIAFERLKRTIDDQLARDVTLMEAAMTQDFHNAAHFTRNFRGMFGVAPSFGYGRS